MNDIELSRRKILAAMAAAGGAGSLVGSGTGAVFSDEELFTNNSVQASTKIGGVVDIDVVVEELPGEEGARYSVSLPDDGSSTTTNNPAYIWLRTLQCPKPENLADEVEIRVMVSYDGGDTETQIYPESGSASVLDVLDEFRTGIHVGQDADDPCMQPGDEWLVDFEVTKGADTDEQVGFELEYYAQQCRYKTGPTNPWGEGEVIEECGSHSSHNPKAISFIAFCSTEGNLEDAIAGGDLTVTKWKDGAVGDEPLAVEWDSDEPVDTIVLKAGQEMENFSPSDLGTRGTVEVGDGVPADANQSPSEPCPSGSGIKFDFESGTFQKDAEGGDGGQGGGGDGGQGGGGDGGQGGGQGGGGQ